MYIFSYLHLNPLSRIERDWKEKGVKNKKRAEQFIKEYRFSSYQDFLDNKRSETSIINFALVPEYIKNMNLDLKTQERTHLFTNQQG
jgi:hypothetical protein